jgi:LPS-assembly lipoprotein
MCVLNRHRNTVITCVCTLALAACGFRPLHGGPEATAEQASLRQELATVFVATIPERSGQQLRNLLIEQLGFGSDPAAPRYTLNVVLEETINALGIRQDATSSYGRLTIVARYSLTDTTTGKSVLRDSTRAFSGYTIVDSEYAALTAEREAREKTLRQLAETLARRVTVQLSGS